MSMGSTKFKKILPKELNDSALPGWVSCHWPFLLTSLALHGFLGLALMEAVFFPKPSSVERIITIQIIEERRVQEEKSTPPPAPKMKKKILPAQEMEEKNPLFLVPPGEEEMPLLPVAWTKEEQPVAPSEKLSPSKQRAQEQMNPKEGEEKAAGIAERQEELTTSASGHGTKVGTLPLERMAQSGKLPARQGRTWLGGDVLGPGGGEGRSSGDGQEKKTSIAIGEKKASSGSLKGKGKGPGDLSSYLGAARSRIEKVKKYPGEALRQKWEGRVILSFQINWQGEVNDIKLIQSSGYRVLDEEGKATLRRASPLPLPPYMDKENLELEVPIVFRLDWKK